jgi:hypothetical protein
MKLKLKGRRFDAIEEIQAKSQRLLDTLTEKDFQEAGIIPVLISVRG